MNEATEVIRKQIESCRELLKIFQNERQLYLDRPNINLDDVTRILCRKKQLVEIFDQQQQFIRDFKNQAQSSGDSDDKELMRELGSVLEQLLVIDHENEKLLRHCLSTRNPMAAAVSAVEAEDKAFSQNAGNFSARTRPALQRQLPFVPGARPAVQPSPVIPTAERLTSSTSIKTDVPVAARKPEIAAIAPVETEPVSRPAGGRHLIRNYVQTANLLNLSSKYA